MMTPAGFEPDIFWLRTRNPEPLDEGAKYQKSHLARILIVIETKNACSGKNPEQAAL